MNARKTIASRCREGARKGSRGFSLTELLVVLVVMAVLAGLLFPMFKQAYRALNQANCVSNLHQISSLAAAYSSDHDGNPVPIQDPAVTEGVPPSWRYLLLQQILYDPNAEKITLKMASGVYNHMWCRAFVAKYGRMEHPNGRGSYSMNWFFSRGNTIPKVPALTSSSEPYIVCGYPNWVDTSWGANNGLSTMQNVKGGNGYLHSGRTNVLWFDGSVSSLNQDEASDYETAVRRRIDF